MNFDSQHGEVEMRPGNDYPDPWWDSYVAYAAAGKVRDFEGPAYRMLTMANIKKGGQN